MATILNLHLTPSGYTSKVEDKNIVREITKELFPSTNTFQYNSSFVIEESIDTFIRYSAEKNITVILNR